MGIIDRAVTQLRLGPPGRASAPDAGEALPAEQRVFGLPGRTSRRITLDIDRLRRHGVASPRDSGRLSEQIRAVKRQLLRQAFPPGAEPLRRGTVMLVTSAQPGEGKTFMAANLAL